MIEKGISSHVNDNALLAGLNRAVGDTSHRRTRLTMSRSKGAKILLSQQTLRRLIHGGYVKLPALPSH
jgi:hypothetical protein